jgi:hypothetical protein
MVNKKYSLIGVEGNHDQAFLCKVICKLLGFKKFDGQVSELDGYWRKFIPNYPPKNGRIYARLDMPSILFKEDVFVAVYVGEGDNLVPRLSAKLADMDHEMLFAFGILADSDNNTPEEVAARYSLKFQEFFPDFPRMPGTVSKGKTRSGIYVLPDNLNPGVLETLLCKCGENVYPTYMERANAYINQFSKEEIEKLKWKPYDRQKALIATVASILRPGKTNTVSIADNDWICKKTLEEVPEMSQISVFLGELLN